jgi:signal transduction histidine kinase
MVAASEKEIARPLGQFREQLLLAFGLIGAVLSLGAWLQVTVGLGPLRQLRQQIAAIRAGSLARLQGDFPNEVAPLVGELNDVIEARDASLERARRRAGDLAHGLKTPLTVLSAIARDLRKSRRRREAADIEAQTETMRIHVERALARARLSTGRGHAVTELRPVAEKVIATLQRLPDAGKLVFDLAVPPGTMVPMEQGDLTEFLGNLLDNARKWAASRVRIGYAEHTLAIDDDGPGVDEENIRRIVERGRRLDEAKQGSGLGLSIVQDIADIYNLNVVFGRSDLGGLKVAIRH